MLFILVIVVHVFFVVVGFWVGCFLFRIACWSTGCFGITERFAELMELPAATEPVGND